MDEYPDVWLKKPFEEEDLTEEEKIELKKFNEESPLSKWGIYDQLHFITTSQLERNYWMTRNIREFLKEVTYFNVKAREELRMLKMKQQ
jgi:ribosomal protein L33